MRVARLVRYKLRGWKTIWVNATIGLPAALYGIYLEFSAVDFTPVIPTKYVAAFLVANAVLGVVLRIMTTGPVGDKGGDPNSIKAN